VIKVDGGGDVGGNVELSGISIIASSDVNNALLSFACSIEGELGEEEVMRNEDSSSFTKITFSFPSSFSPCHSSLLSSFPLLPSDSLSHFLFFPSFYFSFFLRSVLSSLYFF
jgi:hypothetical protein